METTVKIKNFLSLDRKTKIDFILEEMSTEYKEYFNGDDTPALLEGTAEVLALSIDTLILCGELANFDLATAIYYQINTWDETAPYIDSEKAHASAWSKSTAHADNFMRKLTEPPISESKREALSALLFDFDRFYE